MAARSSGVSSIAGSRQISIRYLIVVSFLLTRTTNPKPGDGQLRARFLSQPPARTACPGNASPRQDAPGGLPGGHGLGHACRGRLFRGGGDLLRLHALCLTEQAVRVPSGRDNERVTDRWPPGRYVVVSGPPASGKTTLARALAPALGLPLIAKDTIKQALMTVLPVPDVPASRTIGRASVAALLAVAAEAPGAVLESVWHRSHAAAELGNLPGNLVEVFCRCDPAIAAERYARRAGTRAAGHFDAKRTIEELWNDDVA